MGATVRFMRVLSRPGVTGCLLVYLAVAAPGCSASTPEKVRVEAYSWWRRPSEQRAFDNILRLYNASHSDAEAFNEASDTQADDVRETLTARLLAGAPPSTFQANLGADVLRWSVVDTTGGVLPSSSRIKPLSEFFSRRGLLPLLPQVLVKELERGTAHEPYTVPIDIHRLNVLYYNTAALSAFRERHAGKSFLDRELLCPADLSARLADSDSKLDVKIAVGSKDTFALTLITFESVLPALAGPTLYDDLFRGRASGDWASSVRTALMCVQYLSRSFLDTRNDDWAEALAQVATGNADFSVMGDWSNGELKSALQRGVVDAQPFPGSELSFVFTSDTFPLPVDVPYPKGAEDLLDVIASPEGQLEFSLDKGSIPARSDVDLSALGARALRTRQDFDSSAVTKVLATSGLFPPYFPGAELNAALSAMTGPGATAAQIEAVLALLSDAQPLLARWQSRLGTEP